MALTDAKIRAAKPKDKPYKLADEKGMYLLVQPTGRLLWRLKFRRAGKEYKLSMGTYPDTTLKQAREKRDQARGLIGQGLDPREVKRTERAAQEHVAANTFELLAEEYLGKLVREGRSEGTVAQNRRSRILLQPVLGKKAVSTITSGELLSALRPVELSGRLDTARRMRSFASRVFRYAIATDRRQAANPADTLVGALAAPQVEHRPAITDPIELGGLLRAIDGYKGQATTRAALALAPHVFQRPGELRQAEWAEFDLDAAVWSIPATKMKMREPHVMPLSRQAVTILRDIALLTGHGRYVFPSIRGSRRPLSENTLNAALRRMGYAKEEMCTHGFRSTASTMLHESGKWRSEATSHP